VGRPGYGVERGFKALLLQWMEDLSDRELERFLQENTSAKMFCDFSLTEKVPDHTYFCQLRKNLGTEKLVKLFNRFNDKMRAKGLRHVCPRQGMTLEDKVYCTKEAQKIMRQKGCHSGAILKDNMKSKNRDKDRFLTELRMPYEGVFSKMDKKVRYIGIVKTQFQATMQAFAHNIKRLLKIPAPPLIFG